MTLLHWESAAKEIEVLCACTEKRRGLCGKKNDGFGSTGDGEDGQGKATTDGQNQGGNERREQTRDRAVRRRLVQHIDPTRSGIRCGSRRLHYAAVYQSENGAWSMRQVTWDAG